MIIDIYAKNIEKFGKVKVAEFNRLNDVLTFDIHTSRFINNDYTLRIPEIEIPDTVKSVVFADLNARVKIKVTKEDLVNTLKDGEYDIPYKEWEKSKNTY